MRGNHKITQIAVALIAVMGIIPLRCTFGQDETVDRILALVNGQVITLTDVRIAKDFGLYERGPGFPADATIERVLQKLIDQRLVIQVTRDDTSVNRKEMDAFLTQISEEMGSDRFHRELDKFGLQRNDLEPYAYERILFNRILSSRFDRAVLVTLEEIQAFYETRYLPDQRNKGIEPQSMLDIFDDIEAQLRREKSEEQVEEWIQNLREKAEIQINLNP